MTFGTHGGEDHYVITQADEVERLLRRDVNDQDLDQFRTELAIAAPYEKSQVTRVRIHLAMLYLADGDLAELRSVRKVADSDWRDLLVMAEYPSTPPYGTSETPQQKRSRQKRDIEAIAAWRNRSGPPRPEAGP